MRTTVTLDDDVVAAVNQLRRERGVGVSEAVNGLARAGLAARSKTPPFRQRSVNIGLKIDVTNVAEAIDLIDGPAAR